MGRKSRKKTHEDKTENPQEEEYDQNTDLEYMKEHEQQEAMHYLDRLYELHSALREYSTNVAIPIFDNLTYDKLCNFNDSIFE